MALDIFLRLGDIKGESSDARHRDEICVLSWDFGITQALIRNVGGGAAAAKPQFRNLRFAHGIDAASPAIMLACASAKRMKEAVLSVRRIGDPATDMIVLRLEAVLVVSVESAVNEANGELYETVALAYDKIKFDYVPVEPEGAASAAHSFAWAV